MRAAYYERTGPANEVITVGTLPDPHPGEGEVRVRLLWSGINPSDVKQRSGARSSTMPFARVVPQSDGMGVIDEVGAGIARSRLGERVWTWNAAWGRPDGTAAEYVVLPAPQAVFLPEATSDEAGACLGIPALTALHALLSDGGVAGKRVLVAGGAGAVGHYAIQFARRLGALQVLATVSSDTKAALAQGAGADTVVNYRLRGAAELLRQATGGAGVDRIVEVDMATNAELDLDVVARDGIIVAYGSRVRELHLSFSPLITKNVSVRFFMVYDLAPGARQNAISTMTGWLARGEVQHRIGARLHLASIAAGHLSVESGEIAGNIVLSI